MGENVQHGGADAPGTHYFGDGCQPPHECPCDHSNPFKADLCGTCGEQYPADQAPPWINRRKRD